MTAPKTSLAFFKLNTPDMERALRFYSDAFGFTVTMTFDEPEFLEHIMALPGQEAGPSLLLVEYKTGKPVDVGPGHGPVGFMTEDIETQFAKLEDAGAKVTLPIFEMGGTKIAMLLDPDGHEIELVQPPTG